MSDLAVAIVLGIIEGLTEFVPVSSTGHLIVAGHMLGFDGERAETFEVVIQLGAVLAVALLYRHRILSMLRFTAGSGLHGRNGLVLLGITTTPALILGAAFQGVITGYLFSPFTVAIGWGLGGLGLLYVERHYTQTDHSSLDALGVREAIVIGLFQCLALWPGVSRSAATISGAMLLKFGRRASAEYSFLAALPVISAAAAAQLYSGRDTMTSEDAQMFATGFCVAFVSAWFAVRFFLRLLAVNTLRPFGWYRIGAAMALLIAVTTGWLK